MPLGPFVHHSAVFKSRSPGAFLPRAEPLARASCPSFSPKQWLIRIAAWSRHGISAASPNCAVSADAQKLANPPADWMNCRTYGWNEKTRFIKSSWTWCNRGFVNLPLPALSRRRTPRLQSTTLALVTHFGGQPNYGGLKCSQNFTSPWRESSSFVFPCCTFSGFLIIGLSPFQSGRFLNGFLFLVSQSPWPVPFGLFLFCAEQENRVDRANLFFVHHHTCPG